MNRPALPMPPLIAALREAGAADATAVGAAATVASALGRLAGYFDLRGLRVEFSDADPLPAFTSGWGTLAAGPTDDEPLRISGESGRTVARVWAGAAIEPQDLLAALGAAIEAARAHLRAERAENHLAALDAAVHGISGALAVDVVLQLIVDRVRTLADAGYAALGIVGADGVIDQFLTSGISDLERAHIGALPRGHGLLGLLIREGTSIRIPDIEQDPRRYGFPPHHPEMHSFLGVPVTVRGRSVGNLYLTNKRGRPEFSEADLELVERFALHAGIAIDTARLTEQVGQLAVIEERERIGADLHDGVIQRIYGVNLSLDEVPEIVRDRPDEAARRVEQAIDALNDAVGEIREVIYILRPPGADGGLNASLHALATEVRLQTGLPVELDVDAPALSGGVIRELLSLVREALSNVARHAGAGAVEVTARPEGELLRVEVTDDGIGFDVDQADRDPSHHGLLNMRDRAERVGGRLEVVSRHGAGTRIIVTLPIADRIPAAGGSEST